MPYVTQELRNIVLEELEIIQKEIGNIPADNLNGMLNYCITEIVVRCVKRKYGDKWRYNAINDIIGIFGCAAFEAYRRIGGPYEDQCILKNGDVRAYE